MLRKYSSGHENRKKKRLEQLIHSQKGALDKFFQKKSQLHEGTVNPEEELNVENVAGENVEPNNNVVNDVEAGNTKKNNGLDGNLGEGSDHININNNVQPNSSVLVDIYDPRRYDALVSNSIDLLVVNGPKRNPHHFKRP